jgi:hypothetical protein
MDLPSVASLELLPRIEERLPAGAIAVAGDLFYPDFRAREFPDLKSVLWAVLVWTAGDLSLKDAAAVVSAAGIRVSKSSLEERFERATRWLRLLLSMTLCGNACYPKGGEVRVVVADSTSLSAPGAKGTDFRVHALFDSATGALIAAEVTDASVGESATHHPLGRESLGMDDRGYCNAKNLHSHAARGSRFLTRCNPHSIRLCDASGEVLRPDGLACAVTTDTPIDLPVRIPARLSCAKGPAWHRHPKVRFVEARLIGIRTPKGVLWLLTDMPAEALPARVAGELYRRRWQIELLFKALKSIAGLDRLKSRGPTATAWICGKLMLAALAQRLVPSFAPDDREHPENPYRDSAWSRLRIGLIAVTCAVLGGPVAALVVDRDHMRRLRNAPRRRLQQRPVAPFNPSINQPSLA